MIAVMLLAAAAVASSATPAARERTIRAALATPALRAGFAQDQARWRQAIVACGRRAACRASAEAGRDAYLAALAARVSPENPTLADLDAAALVGRFTAGPPRRIDPGQVDMMIEDGVPEPHSTLSARPGELCAPACHDAGYEPGRLGGGAIDTAVARALGLAPGAPAWTVYRDGRAGYRLIAARGTPYVIATVCAADASACGPALVALTPETADAGLRRLRPPARQ